jgi:hypothetical protein
LILAFNHLLQGIEAQPVVAELLRSDLHPDLPLYPAGHIHFQHPGDRFDFILQVIGNLLQAGQTAGAGEGKNDDRHLGKVDLKDRGIFVKIGGQLALGFIDLVLDVLQGPD